MNDDTHVCLGNSKDLFIVLLAVRSIDNAKRDTNIVPSVCQDSLISRDIDRLHKIARFIRTCRELELYVFCDLTCRRIGSEHLDSIEGVQEI